MAPLLGRFSTPLLTLGKELRASEGSAGGGGDAEGSGGDEVTIVAVATTPLLPGWVEEERGRFHTSKEEARRKYRYSSSGAVAGRNCFESQRESSSFGAEERTAERSAFLFILFKINILASAWVSRAFCGVSKKVIRVLRMYICSLPTRPPGHPTRARDRLCGLPRAQSMSHTSTTLPRIVRSGTTHGPCNN